MDSISHFSRELSRVPRAAALVASCLSRELTSGLARAPGRGGYWRQASVLLELSTRRTRSGVLFWCWRTWCRTWMHDKAKVQNALLTAQVQQIARARDEAFFCCNVDVGGERSSAEMGRPD